jgi:Na+-translocating ferredoxin:NAD+ oxidoreductase subunit D
MEKLLHVSSSPHVRDHSSTESIMRDVCIAMLPMSAYGVIHFGLHSLLVLVLTVAACVAAEYIYETLMKRPVTITDFSAVVTGMILALNMPPQVPVWMPMLGGVFAIVVVKQLYGGLGQNFMNPALAGRCFLLISFAGKLNDFTCAKIGFDAVSGATPLAQMKNGMDITYSLSDLFLGNIPGTIGEVSTLCVLIGAAYMVARKVISINIPLTYIATFAVFYFIFGGFNAYATVYELCAGGLMFGAFFMATDYVTSPITPKGQIVFGVFLGVMTGIFRLWGASAEGVSYAIVLGNMMVPLIEKVTLPVVFGKEAKK